MASIRTRVEPIDRNIALSLTEELSPAGRSRTLAQFARSALSEAKQQNQKALGRVPPYRTFVDGTEGGSEDRVSPDGVIVYEFDLVIDALLWIGDELKRRSPRLTGKYGKSHILFADGSPVNIDGGIPPAEKYIFLNDQPYARKIEGDDAREPQSRQAPEGVYKVVARDAARRFGNSARITFTFESALGGAVHQWSLTPSARSLAARSRGGNPEKHTDWLTRVPAILVRLPR